MPVPIFGGRYSCSAFALASASSWSIAACKYVAAVAAAVEAATAVASVVLSRTAVTGVPRESFCLRTSASILFVRYSVIFP